MNTAKQTEVLNSPSILLFKDKLKEIEFYPLSPSKIDIFQINMGFKCNLKCKHCHVNAGPNRTESMSNETLNRCLKVIQKHKFSTIDITGGSPELIPNIKDFISEIAKLKTKIILRSNMTLLCKDKYRSLVETLINNKVEIIGSMPSVDTNKTNIQRGNGTFSKIIESIQMLNKQGYSQPNSDLKLNLVHNPSGAYLPSSQQVLEKEYKKYLQEKFNISFNNLFCITNMPINRFLDFLIQKDMFNEYMEELVSAYNKNTVPNLMCRNTISVGWDGQLYDCDFNQMLGLTVQSESNNIDNFDLDKLNKRKIIVHNHCYGCTAGSGSSCQGNTA
jgi:radical SAM/Cys-rich protein